MFLLLYLYYLEKQKRSTIRIRKKRLEFVLIDDFF